MSAIEFLLRFQPIFGPGDRIRARLQYDYTHSDTDAIGSEHAAWFQIQIQWGGQGGSHAGHNH